jgi:hypothetical protein
VTAFLHVSVASFSIRRAKGYNRRLGVRVSVTFTRAGNGMKRRDLLGHLYC